MKKTDITHNILEKAFLADGNVNMNFMNGDTNTEITSNGCGILVKKTVDLDPYLQQAAQDRADYVTGSRNTQDHVKKIASIPKEVYYSIMEQAEMMNITNKKEKNAFLIQQLKRPEFEALLSLPKGMIRKSK